MIAAGDGVGGRPGQRYVQRVGGGGQSAQVDQEALVVVLVGLGFAGAKGGGDVPGDPPAVYDMPASWPYQLPGRSGRVQRGVESLPDPEAAVRGIHRLAPAGGLTG